MKHTHPNITSKAARDLVAHELRDLLTIRRITIKHAPEKKAIACKNLIDARFWLLYFAVGWQDKINSGAYLGREF